VADCPSDLVGGVTGAGEGAVTKVEWKTPSFQKTLPTDGVLEVEVSNNRDARISEKDGQSTGHFHAGETTVTYYMPTVAPEGRLALCTFKVTVPQVGGTHHDNSGNHIPCPLGGDAFLSDQCILKLKV
jgi:hypothetical protein